MSIDFYDVWIILNMLLYYLFLNFFVLFLNFLFYFSIDDFCLKDVYVILKSYVIDKFRYG